MLEELKKEVCQANLELYRSGLVPLTFGNTSGIDRGQGLVVIKPSGVAYTELKPECMVVVDLAGKRVDGKHNPSTDTPTHLELYRTWDHVGGITHTHSPWATMFAQAERPLPCMGTTHADHFRGDVPVTRALTQEEVEGAYEKNTGAVIVERFDMLSPLEMPAVLVAGHGAFTWGRDAEQSVINSLALEESARMALGTLLLNPKAPPLAAYLMDKHYSRKHGPGAYYGQDEE